MNPVIGNLIKSFPRMSTEYKVVVEFIIHSLPIGNTANLFLFTGQNILTGGGIPKLIINKSPKTTLKLVTPVNGTLLGVRIDLGAQILNHSHRLEVEQRYLKDGLYRFVTLINGQELHSTINVNAKQFYDIKCYVSSPGSPTLANATIRHLSLTNFL